MKREKVVLITGKKMIVGLKIMKRMQKPYCKDGNRDLRDEINLLLVSLRIIKRVQKTYGRNSNGYLREEMNLFTNKK